MLAVTTFDTGIPPAWNAAVMEIGRAQAEDCPKTLFTGIKPWHYFAGNALTTARIALANRVETLGWTPAEVLETHLRLRTFAEDWDAPGMEVYDDL